MPSYKLSYFAGRGRAEVSRLILSEAGVEWEDDRVTDWPALKETIITGQMPVLFVDGKQICQSGVIHRFLANTFGLMGDSVLAGAYADMVYETLNEMYFKLPLFEKDAEKKKAETDKQFAEKIMPFLVKMNGKHANDPEKGNKDHFIGGKLTLADIALAFFIGEMKNHKADVCDTIPASRHCRSHQRKTEHQGMAREEAREPVLNVQCN